MSAGSPSGSPSSATLTITDNDKAGTLALNASAYTIGETGGTLHVTVTRTGGAAGGVSVNYQLSNGTATYPGGLRGRPHRAGHWNRHLRRR